jgi:transcriptional antiterminator RfaH
MIPSQDSPPSWFAVHTKPREEDRADRNLRAWGIETVTPMVRETVYRRSAYTRAPAIKPLFPQYLFARFSLDELLAKIRFTRGVHALVNIGGVPVPVPDDVIALVRARIGPDGLVRLEDELRQGDSVVIQSGYLKGFAGVFQRQENGETRVTILLNALQCQPRLVIERARLRKVPAGESAL